MDGAVRQILQDPVQLLGCGFNLSDHRFYRRYLPTDTYRKSCIGKTVRFGEILFFLFSHLDARQLDNPRVRYNAAVDPHYESHQGSSRCCHH